MTYYIYGSYPSYLVSEKILCALRAAVVVQAPDAGARPAPRHHLNLAPKLVSVHDLYQDALLVLVKSCETGKRLPWLKV